MSEAALQPIPAALITHRERNSSPPRRRSIHRQYDGPPSPHAQKIPDTIFHGVFRQGDGVSERIENAAFRRIHGERADDTWNQAMQPIGIDHLKMPHTVFSSLGDRSHQRSAILLGVPHQYFAAPFEVEPEFFSKIPIIRFPCTHKRAFHEPGS